MLLWTLPAHTLWSLSLQPLHLLQFSLQRQLLLMVLASALATRASRLRHRAIRSRTIFWRLIARMIHLLLRITTSQILDLARALQIYIRSMPTSTARLPPLHLRRMKMAMSAAAIHFGRAMRRLLQSTTTAHSSLLSSIPYTHLASFCQMV